MNEALATKMRAIALRFPHKRRELEQHADALEEAAGKVFSSKEKPSEDDMKKMIGIWARSRRLYCDLTGEPLV